MAVDEYKQLSSLTGARQTMLSWAKVIETFDAVPEAYQVSFKSIIAENQPFPFTVFAPSIAGIARKTTEKLLCEVNDSLYIWERIGNRVNVSEYALNAISDLEMGCILLFSWITISGVSRSGLASATTIEYNTATARYFAPFVKKLRPVPDEQEQSVELAKFDYLETINFKFMNYAIESLVAGEKVVQTVWQPKISKPVVTLWGRTLYQTNQALAHLTILTDRELIVISDDERSRENRGVRYGGIWQYIALSHIRAASLIGQAGDLRALSLTLSPGGRHREILFGPAQEQAILRLRDELEKRIISVRDDPQNPDPASAMPGL